MQPGRYPSSMPGHRPPPLSEQVLVGFAVGVLSAGADLSIALARSGQGGAVAEWAHAGLHLVALEAPFGVALGLVAGLTLAALRVLFPTRAPAPGLFGHHPDAFSAGLGILAAAAVFVPATRVAAEHFATRYHDPKLAAWAMAVTTLGLLVGAVVIGALVSASARPLARHLGRAASTGGVLLVALAAVVAVALGVALRSPRLLEVYDPVALLWAPGLVVAYVAAAIFVRRVLARRSRSRASVRWAALAVVSATVAGLGWSAFTYGDHQAPRGLVEHRTVVGLPLLRLYMHATDRDGDGHSFAFGGGDCDDGNPRVYPGALDVPGDGVDADCFAGDGSPDVADLGNGVYGQLPEGVSRPNILLVTIDALRADHLGSYGYERPVSPHIDSFAKERAVRFEEVVAQSSRSIRSLPAMMTGFYPSQIAYGNEYLFPSLLLENTLLAEVLRDAGYRTAVTMGTDYFERVSHFFQGFEEVQQLDRYRPPRSQPVSRALKQLEGLERGEQPWFLWVHLFNVHEEYLWDRTPSRFGDDPIDQYDTEIVLADREVGRLLEALEHRGLRDDTVVAITSDHGEAFGEHGNRGHSRTLYEEELRVPLLIHVPGVEPRVVEEGVPLFDLMPTFLNLAEAPVPKPMPARSLVPLLTGRGASAPDRLVFSELLPDGLYPYDQKAIRRGDMKLIWWVREGSTQLYDLDSDPDEKRNLADERPELAAEMLGLLRAWVAETSRPEERRRNVVERNRLDREPARMTRRLDARFPGFTLLGFDLPERTFEPGDRIEMTFYYRVDRAIRANYFFYVDIKGPSGYRVPPHFHAHHFPMNGRYPTSEWNTGEVLRDPVEMIVPKDIDHPVTLQIDLSVRNGNRLVTYRHEGNEASVLDLAQVDIR